MRVIGWDMLLCEECAAALPYLDCVPWQAIFPAEIDGSPTAFDRAEALFEYSGTARDALLSLKYRRGVRFADYSAERIAEKLAADDGDDADIITSVPMHRAKKQKRGYNQAEVFAKALSRATGIEYVPDLLGHRKRTVSQHELGRTERYSLAKNTYFISGNVSLSGKRILLCDDVFTTGATLNACAGLLKEMGAERVTTVTICRTVPPAERKDKAENNNDTVI